MSATEKELREHLTHVCHDLYRQGLIAAGDGNVSVRLSDNEILVTPSGFHKGKIGPHDLVVCNLRGEILRGDHKPSSEFLMHELVYLERPDIAAVVHAHPPASIALALAGVDLTQGYLSETCLVLGPIPTAPYSTPTTNEVPETLRPFVKVANAIILNRHGALTYGRNLDEAYSRMEALEHASKIIYMARSIGPIEPLTQEQQTRLEQLARELGIPRA